MFNDEESTQPIEILSPSDADVVCAAWMQRGRVLAEQRTRRDVVKTGKTSRDRR